MTDLEGRALKGGSIEIWQCDQHGHYLHPGDGNRADRAFQGIDRMVVDSNGRWRFRTIRPLAYGGRAPHIHVKIKLGARELLTTQLYVDGNARDGIWRSLAPEDRATVTSPFVSAADGLASRYALVVAS